MKFAWVGYTATVLTCLSVAPSIYTSVVEKSVHSTTYSFVVLSIMGQVFWLIYGYNNKDWSITFMAIYLIIAFIIIGFSKAYYEAHKKDTMSQLKQTCSL